MTHFRLLVLLSVSLVVWYPQAVALAVPPNDTLAQSIALVPYDSGSSAGSNAGTLPDLSEPIACNEWVGGNWFYYPVVVWYNVRYDIASGVASIKITESNFDTVLGVYRQNPTTQALTLVACNDDSNSSVRSQVEFEVSRYDYVLVAVSGFRNASGNFTIASGFRPQHDAFADAVPLRDASAYGYSSFDSSNRGATRELGEPAHHSMSIGKSVWHTWSPVLDGIASIAATSPELDTVLAVYKGSSLSNLTLLASNDDYGGSLNSFVTFPLVSGSQYLIAVDGFGGSAGRYKLSAMTRPWNDDISSAQVIALAENANGRNVGATFEAAEPRHGGVGSVWYKWTASSSGLFTVKLTSDNSYAGLLNVYTGIPFSDFVSVTGGREQNGPLRFSASEGQDYFFAVDSLDGDPPITLFDFTLEVNAVE